MRGGKQARVRSWSAAHSPRGSRLRIFGIPRDLPAARRSFLRSARVAARFCATSAFLLLFWGRCSCVHCDSWLRSDVPLSLRLSSLALCGEARAVGLMTIRAIRLDSGLSHLVLRPDRSNLRPYSAAALQPEP